MPEPDPQAVASPATVRSAARYLGVSQKGLQICIDRGYTSLRSARYLGIAQKALQLAYSKFAILAVGVTSTVGKTVTIDVSGSTAGGVVVIVWGDGSGNTNLTCDAQGKGVSQHTYATAATFTINASQGGRNSAPVNVTTT